MMRAVESLLTRMPRVGVVRVISPRAAPIIGIKLAKPSLQALQPLQQQEKRCYVQGVDQYRRKTTTLQSMREFFMHPLTWDRNNGYLNVVLALAIFAFIFVNSCTPCPEDRVEHHKKED